MKNRFAVFAIGLLVISACAAPTESVPVLLPPTASPQPIVFPTPSSIGDAAVWEGMQVALIELEITQEYMTDFGSVRIPSAEDQFLWAHVRLENTGTIEVDVPLLENFSLLYAAMELKPTYGHRADRVDYTTLGPIIFPGQELDGWLRFDIPSTAELSELRFVFLPESAQVGSSYGSPHYPYAADKPTYVWNCAP